MSVQLAKSIPVLIETLIIAILILLFSEALLGPLLTVETRPDDSPILRLIWLPAYFIIFLFGIYRILRLANLAMRMPVLVLLIAFVAASTLWSIDDNLTLRRAIALGMTTVFGLYLAVRYNWRELLALFGFVWLILCVGSFVVSLAVPSLGVDSVEHPGAWKGLWFQKNALGGHMARASFLFGFLAITQIEFRKFWLAGLGMSIMLVLLSTSATSLLGMLLGFMVLGIGWFMRIGPVFSLTAFWGMVTFGSAFGYILITDPGLILGLIGRDATLTGRTDIWEVLLQLIRERSERGYGYGAFWSEGSAPALYVREITQWNVPTAHNGWLEVWLGIGFWGLSIYTVSFILMSARAVATAFSSWNGFYALGFILQFLLFSLSESIILQQNAITWLSYVAVSAALVQQNLDRDPINLLGLRRNRDFILSE